jgi:hypothetical protein
MSKKLSTQEKARRMWVRALRSGKYGWGKEELHPKDGKFCCLGVLCEVAIKQGIISSYRHHLGILPEKVQNWIGLGSDVGDMAIYIKDEDSLAGINDSAKRNPFTKIANLIEKKPEGLFSDQEQA